MAGLTAANAASCAGAEVVVLEARDRIGGPDLDRPVRTRCNRPRRVMGRRAGREPCSRGPRSRRDRGSERRALFSRMAVWANGWVGAPDATALTAAVMANWDPRTGAGRAARAAAALAPGAAGRGPRAAAHTDRGARGRRRRRPARSSRAARSSSTASFRPPATSARCAASSGSARARRPDGPLLGRRRRHPPHDQRRPGQEPALAPQRRRSRPARGRGRAGRRARRRCHRPRTTR